MGEGKDRGWAAQAHHATFGPVWDQMDALEEGKEGAVCPLGNVGCWLKKGVACLW